MTKRFVKRIFDGDIVWTFLKIGIIPRQKYANMNSDTEIMKIILIVPLQKGRYFKRKLLVGNNT